jgi:hypothetical protein
MKNKHKKPFFPHLLFWPLGFLGIGSAPPGAFSRPATKSREKGKNKNQ